MSGPPELPLPEAEMAAFAMAKIVVDYQLRLDRIRTLHGRAKSGTCVRCDDATWPCETYAATDERMEYE